MNRELRAHQIFAIEQLRASLLSGKKRPMLSLPTGAGKTVIAASIVESALAKGKRVIFVVPAVTLVDQTVQRFFEEGIHDVGVIQAQHEMTDWTQPVQVASVQTLMRRKRLPEADLVVIDEAHRWFRWYGTWMAMDDWRRVPFVGLSATPWTRGLGKHYDDLVVVATTGQLIEQGYLSPFRVFAPAHPDLGGVRTVAGDYHEGELSEAMSKPELVADIVTTWLERGEGRPTLCFGVDRAHAQRIHQQFLAAGVPSAYVDAFTDDDDRREIASRFASGAVKIVCNVGVLTTGVDWDVRCIILARPTKSEMLFVQIVGRGLRTAPGKADCLILDHSDTTLKLGFVTDIHHDSLDTGKPQETRERQVREALPKECPKCAFVKPAKVHACPSCGFAPERMSAVEVKDGQLVELDGRRRAKPQAASIDEKVDYMAQLRGYAAEHGYASGWVSHKFRERFGVWPNDGRVRNALAKPCGRAVRTWITSRNIAFAKGRQKAAAQ